MEDVSAAPETAGSEPDPVSMIQGILEREDAPPKAAGDQKPEPEPPPAEQEPEPEPETPSDEEGDSDNDGEEETQEQPDQEQEPELIAVKVGDREEKVTLDELKRGYQRQSDYSRHMNQLAEQRRAAEAAQQSIASERAHYSQNLEQLSTVLQATLPPRPPLEMSETDPIGYTQQNARWEASVQQLQHVMAEQQRVQQQQAQHFEQQRRQSLAQAAEHLVELVPEWKDPAKANVEKKAVAEFLKTVGYADHEIANAADPRALAMARKAMLYDKLMASKPSVDQRLAKAPKVVKPGSGIAAPDKRKSLRSSIQRSGGTDLDAVARLIDLG